MVKRQKVKLCEVPGVGILPAWDWKVISKHSSPVALTWWIDDYFWHLQKEGFVQIGAHWEETRPSEKPYLSRRWGCKQGRRCSCCWWRPGACHCWRSCAPHNQRGLSPHKGPGLCCGKEGIRREKDGSGLEMGVNTWGAPGVIHINGRLDTTEDGSVNWNI